MIRHAQKETALRGNSLWLYSLPYFVSAAFLALMAVLTRLIRVDLRAPKERQIEAPDVASNEDEGDATRAAMQQRGVGKAMRKVFRDIGEGFAFVWKEPVLRANCLIFMAVNAGFAFTVNTTMYHLMLRGYTAFELSIMESVFAALMIVASILAGRYLPRFRSGRVLLVAFSGMLAVSILATSSHGYVQLLVWLALYGLVLPFIASTAQGYMFSTTPGHLQGRVNSVAGIAELGVTAFVPAITGALVGAGYVVLSFGIGAVVAALSVAGVLASRGLRTLGKPSEWHPNPAEDDD